MHDSQKYSKNGLYSFLSGSFFQSITDYVAKFKDDAHANRRRNPLHAYITGKGIQNRRYTVEKLLNTFNTKAIVTDGDGTYLIPTLPNYESVPVGQYDQQALGLLSRMTTRKNNNTDADQAFHEFIQIHGDASVDEVVDALHKFCIVTKDVCSCEFHTNEDICEHQLFVRQRDGHDEFFSFEVESTDQHRPQRRRLNLKKFSSNSKKCVHCVEELKFFDIYAYTPYTRFST